MEGPTRNANNPNVSRDHSSQSFMDYRPARRPRAPRRPVLWIAMLGIVLLAGLIVAAAPIAKLSAHAWDAQYVAFFGTTRQGKYLPNATFQLVGQGIGRKDGPRIERGYILCDSTVEPGSIGFDLQKNTCELDSYQGKKSGRMPLTRDALATYVLRAGYAAEDLEVKAVTDVLWQELLWLRDGGHRPQVAALPIARPPGVFQSTPTERRFLAVHGFSLLEPAPKYGMPWYTPYLLPVWLLMWWQISRLLMRRYLQKKRMFEAR